MMKRHSLPIRETRTSKLGQPFDDRVGNGQLASILQLHDRHRREAFGDRAQSEHRFKCRGDTPLYISIAEGHFVEDPAMLRDRKGQAWYAIRCDEVLRERLKIGEPTRRP